MVLIVVYLGLMIAGAFLAYLTGIIVERSWPAASLPVFLAMYFASLYVAWVIAVRLTKPKETAA